MMMSVMDGVRLMRWKAYFLFLIGKHVCFVFNGGVNTLNATTRAALSSQLQKDQAARMSRRIAVEQKTYSTGMREIQG